MDRTAVADPLALHGEFEPLDDQEPAVHPLGLRPLDIIPRDPPPPLLIGRLDPIEHTILFGEGDVGKGTIASHWITRLVEEGETILILDYENHPGEWSRRIASLSPTAPGKVFHVAPLAPEWTGIKGPIWDQAEGIRRLVEETGATYLVIDSIVPACGGTDVSSGDTSAPTNYNRALQHIGIRSLSLAHVTKYSDGKYPFGSVHWHNLVARITWSVQKQGSRGDTKLLKNRKHNNYERQPNLIIQVDWHDGLPVRISEKAHAVVLADLIEDILDEPMTPAAVTKRLNEDLDDDDPLYKADSIEKALRRGVSSKPQRFSLSDGQYSRFVVDSVSNRIAATIALKPAVAEEDAA
jgi:AAA domain-containing protein